MRHRPSAAAWPWARSTATSACASAARSARRARRRRSAARARRRSRGAAPTCARCAPRGRSCRPDSQSPTSSPAQLAHERQRARAEHVVREVAGAEPARDAAREAGADRRAPARRRPPAGRGCCASSSTRHSSPVMNVMKSTMRPRLDARPLAVRARAARPARASSRGVDAADDLRLLAAHHVGHAVRVARARAGHDGELAVRACARCPRRAPTAAPGTRRTAPRPSPGGCRSCRRRCAARARRASRRGGARARRAKRPSLHLRDAERRAARRRAPSPSRVHAVRARRRRAPVDGERAQRPSHVVATPCVPSARRPRRR